MFKYNSLCFFKLFNMLLCCNHKQPFQSGFTNRHSTESALLRVLNDISLATDNGHCVILVLLDLTAVFDTVDHQILLSRLDSWVSIRGTALKW